MRVPLSWLRDLVDLPPGETGRTVAERLVRAGLEVETVEEVGADLTGPLVVGRVLAYEEETHRNGKTVRWCQVDVGADAPRGIVCGARNFAVGDLVVVALPGAVLPGGFAISARSTYGHVSDGMICSARELGIGDDHTGILVLPPGSADPGLDAVPALGLRDDVLDIAVTPDRGYALSMRGIGRETATAYDLPYRDPAAVEVAAGAADGHPVRLADPSGCPLFVARTVTGVDPAAPSPAWLQQRLRLAGMRPISVVVDVTNYVMLELGQPLHAYDRDRLEGTIVVRRAQPGEWLRTLDGSERVLDAEDLLITDDSGPIGLAGVMGGESTEVSASTVDVVIEAAHFDPVSVSRTARRHKLPSEASRRFERVVDAALPPRAAQRAADLLVRLAGGTVDGATVEGDLPAPLPVTLPVGLPARVVGTAYEPAEVIRHLTAVGAAVDDATDRDGGTLTVTPPTWRPDLTDPYDLVEEVARLGGYERIPSHLPRATSGRGLTDRQRLRRRVGRALAAAGYVEAPNPPFVGPADWDALLLPADDPRRRAHRLVNPLADIEPLLRTTLLPGLLRTLARNVGRGTADVALFEQGLVFLRRADQQLPAPRLPVDRRPSAEDLSRLEAALPHQPQRVAVALAGLRERAGWWGRGRAAGWADAIEAARLVAAEAGVTLDVVTGADPPFHPGRCARLECAGAVVGVAGELHPRVVEAYALPPRSAAMEVDLDALGVPGTVVVPPVSAFPAATFDVALVVDAEVPAAAVEAALRAGAGDLLEGLRLFDVYTGQQVGEGRRSLAYALRLRARDRTLTGEEAHAVLDAAVAEAARRTGARLRD